jgi:hypothetical protein
MSHETITLPDPDATCPTCGRGRRKPIQWIEVRCPLEMKQIADHATVEEFRELDRIWRAIQRRAFDADDAEARAAARRERVAQESGE